MTAIAARPTLPDFGGHSVDRAAVKVSGSGTGLSDGLEVQPIAYDIGETGYFVIRITCAGVEHKPDKKAKDDKDRLVREHKFHIEQMAPLSEDLARKALQEYAQKIEEAKAAADLRVSLFAEQEAEERERADLAATGSARNTQQP